MPTLKEKMEAKKRAEAAAAGKSAPAGPKLGSTLSEPPHSEAAPAPAVVEAEPKAKSVPPAAPPQPVAVPETREDTPEPATSPVPAPPPVKVVAPKMLRPVSAPRGVLPASAPEETVAGGPSARSKATAPLGTMVSDESERDSTPADEVGSGEIELSSGSSEVPASLKGVDLSVLDEPEEKKDDEKKDAAAKPPAPKKSSPPAMPANPKIQRRQRNFVEGEEQKLSQGFSLEHVESAGTAAAKFVLSGHGIRREIVLTRQKPTSVKLDTEDGEYSVNLLYKERNDEGALVVHSEIDGESKTDKAKEKAAKAAKAAGSAVSNIRHFVPEMIAAAFVPAWSVVLATRDWFRQFSESHSSWPMVGVYAAVALQLGLTVWSAVSRYRKLNAKEE